MSSLCLRLYLTDWTFYRGNLTNDIVNSNYDYSNSNNNNNNNNSYSPMKWTVFPGPWKVDGKGITYIRCTNYSFL